ncbi:V-type proton ATPase subunit E [bioreactor metagenome]|uniref:V-type proton ATPase subunit E n=1 Tax=bioreactor metagenome TaxID=1076179 RepID=A0A644W9P6_9ZZZZ
MNGIEKITARIGDDVRQEIEAVETKAKTEAAEVLARYEAQAEKETNDILKRGSKLADERVERLGSVARLEAKKMILAAKQETLGRAFDLALEQLSNLPEGEYVKLLARLASEASKTGNEQVILSQKDRTRFGKQVVTQANEMLGAKGTLTLAEEVRPMKGGLVLQGERVETNCSFETLVRLQREQIAADVAEVLFEGTV